MPLKRQPQEITLSLDKTPNNVLGWQSGGLVSASVSARLASIPLLLESPMTHPYPPWTLCGHGLQTVHLLDVDRVRPFIPPSLEIISVLPGKTVGSVYVARYNSDSTLPYSELIVASGLVQHNRQIGSWISHIYVDNPQSVEGGREIWGLPKELAEFEWRTDASVKVTQAGIVLCTLNCNWQIPGLSQPLSSPVFSLQNNELICFTGDWRSKFNLAGVKLSIPDTSPFSDLNIKRPLLSLSLNPLHFTANAPTPVTAQDRESVSTS